MAQVDELREHLAAITDFERDYRAYVTSQIAISEGRTGPLREDELPGMRSQLIRRVSRAGRAIGAAGKTMHLAPPPMFGGPVLTTLDSQAFAHETPTFGSGSDPFMSARGVLDVLETAIGELEGQLEHEQRRKAPAHDRAAEEALHHVPTLWGHVRAIPRWIGTAADLITVALFVAGVGRLVGLW